MTSNINCVRNILFLSTFLLINCVSASSIYNYNVETNLPKTIHRTLEPIDDAGKYHVEWNIDYENELINFYIEVETTGFVGFGISHTGGMTGADIIIGGVLDDGTHYFSDRHGVGNSEPVVDPQQDWILNCISENATHTSMNVSRPLNTCDDLHDIAITGDTTKLIWSYGATDVITYHAARGSYAVNLMDPPMPPFDESSADKWLIVANATMPKKDTTYWCSIHKTPDSYTAKRHIIGFQTKLEGAVNLKHTHHFVVFKCAPDPSKNLTAEETFGPYVGKEGGDCFAPEDEVVVPVQLCSAIVYAWAVGGRMMTLPEDVGFPINEEGPEYFMVEMHYDNPDVVEGVRVVSTLEVYNTLNHRPIEAGISVVMHGMVYSHVIPPNLESYITTGHCSSECTSRSLPAEGVSVFNVMLHSHKAGRKIKFRHFRNGVELPWISNDDNYDFDFQQNRPLREFVKIMPGDHLTVECTASTLDRVNTTISGYGTMEEMCQAIFWTYPREGGFPGCQSLYNETLMLNRFGIEAIEPWHHHDMKAPTISAPEELKGQSYLDVLSAAMKDWTPAQVAELQEETRYHNNYQAMCGTPDYNPPVEYPVIDEPYEPTNPCTNRKSSYLNTIAVAPVEPTCRAPDPGDGESTTSNPGDGGSSSPNPGDGGSSSPNPGDGGSSSPNPGDGGSSSPNPGDGGSSSPNPGDGGSSSPNPGDGGTSSPNPGDGGSSSPNPGDGNSSSPLALPYLSLFVCISLLLCYNH